MIPLEIIKNRLGINTLPSFCTYIVTWRCNCRCKMCDIWKKEKGEELSLKEIKNIFKQRRFDAVRITGGEPFLREDLAQVVNIIQSSSKPKMLHITSNGILTKKILEFFQQLEKSDNIHLKISIDALGEKYDRIRGLRGAYNSAIKTVKELAKIKSRLGFYLGINQLILDQEGLNDYYRLKKISDKLNVPVHLALAYEKVALYDEKEKLNFMPKSADRFPCFFNLSRDKRFELLKTLEKMVEDIPDFKERLVFRYDLKGLNNRLVHKKGRPNPPCLALRSHLRILPNGDVPVCIFNSNIAGNLKKTSLKNLWLSKEIKKYRKLVKKCPGCWLACETTPSAIYSGDIIKGLFY